MCRSDTMQHEWLFPASQIKGRLGKGFTMYVVNDFLNKNKEKTITYMSLVKILLDKVYNKNLPKAFFFKENS